MDEPGGADRDLRPLRLQQVALGGVLGPLLPDRVAQGPLSRRVHGGAALVGNRQHRQGGAVHQRGARAGARGAAAGRQRVGLQVHRGRRAADPLRAGRGAERGRGAIESIIAARQRGPLHRRSPTWWSGSTSGSATSGCSSRWSPPARAIRSAGTGSSSSRRWSRRWPRRSCCSRSGRRARRRSSARPDGRTARRRTEHRISAFPTFPPWTEAERLARRRRSSASSSRATRWSATARRSSCSAPAPPRPWASGASTR